jgi:hypothetical protein
MFYFTLPVQSLLHLTSRRSSNEDQYRTLDVRLCELAGVVPDCLALQQRSRHLPRLCLNDHIHGME